MYQILKCVSHLQTQHILTYSKEKLIVYSRDILQQIQTFRDYMSDIVAVATSSKGAFVVFCERELIGYKPLLNGWERSFTKNCTNPIKDAFFSHDDEHIIGCSFNKLHIWKVVYQKYNLLDQVEQYQLVELNEIFTVELAVEITNVKFSPDVRFFCTLRRSKLIVWDFEAINQLQQDGDLSQIPKISLRHNDIIVSFKFRETLRIAPSPYPTPNTIVTLSENHILTIWQEMVQAKNFCKLHTMHLNLVSSFCFIHLHGLKPYPWRNLFLEPDCLGVQDTEQPSVDYLLIHEEQEMKIVRIDYLRNYSLEDSVTVVHVTKSGELLKQIKKIIFANPSKGEIEKMEVIGFDRLWNIIKIVINLNERSKQSFQCEKFTFQNIKKYSYFQKNICLLNNWGQLCLYPLREQNTINQEYGIVEGIKNCWQLNVDMEIEQIHLIKFIDTDIAILVSQDLQQWMAGILVHNQINIQFQLIDSSFFKNYKNIIQVIRINRYLPDLHLLILTKDEVNHVKISIKSFEIIVGDYQLIRQWKITFPFEKMIILQSDLQFIAIEGKQAQIYDLNLKLILTITKNYAIKQVGRLNGQPSIYYVISTQNEVDFHSWSGEFLTRFNLQSFLVRVDKALYDVAKVNVQIIPLNYFAFLLQSDNYLTAFVISFDKNEQQYKLISLKHEYLNQRQGVYCRRLSKQSKNFDYFETEQNIVIKVDNKFKILNNSLVKCLADEHWMPATINFKLMSQLNNIQLYDAEFLGEIISLGKIQLAQHIIELILQKLKQQGSVGNHFIVPYKNLLDLYNLQPNTDWLNSIKTYDSPQLETNIQESIDLSLSHSNSLIKLIQTGQLGQKFNKLLVILEYLKYYEENKLSLDFYAGMFMFHVHQFRNQPSHKKVRTLTSKEIVWALHSLQKETLWQECILSSDDLSWSIIRRYAAVIWMDISFVKNRLEEIALSIYKNTRDPFQSMLYFIILNKKSVITTLFKKEQNQGKEFKNTFEFLEKDFSLDRWKSAASKNAYALVSKKRYQDAAAFFLVGGHIRDGINVIAFYMEDIQLALLTAKLYEPQGGEVTSQLVQDYFIKSGEEINDIWLLHIGYHMLGQYVNSVNILLRESEHNVLEYDSQGKALCNSWPASYTPQLSYYHPSALLLMEKLRDSIQVKREIQNNLDKNKKKVTEEDIFSQFYEDEDEEEEEEIEQVEVKLVEENVELLKQQAVEYYYNIQQPQLGIIFSKELYEQSRHSQLLVEQQVEMYVLQAIKEQEHFTNYVGLMQRLDDLANFTQTKKDKYYEIALNKFKQLKSPARLLTFAIHYDQSGLEEFTQFCEETQCLLYRIAMDYPLSEKSQEFYQTVIQSLYEIDVGLKQFQQSQYYQKKFESKNKLNLIKMFALFLTLIIALELRLFENAFEQLRKLETFCNVVYKQQIQDCGYENLRDDFCELVKQTISNRRWYANKSSKAHRSVDILAEAFPEDRYTEQFQHLQQQPFSEPVQNLIIYFALQSLIVKYFLQISESNFKVEQLNINVLNYSNLFKMAESYANTRAQMVDSLLANLSDFSFEQQMIEDLRLILKEQALTKSQYFKQLQSVFTMPHFFQIAQKIHLDSYIENINIERTKNAFKFPTSSYEEISIVDFKNRLFKQQGVEVYKIKTDNIRALCINNSNPNEGYVLYNKFLKQINLHKTLLYKNRSSDGYSLIDDEIIDEPMKFDQKNTNKPYIVKLCSAALGNLEAKEPILKTRTSLFDEYRNYSENDYLEKFQTCSNKPIQEEDFQCLTSHPYLPLFLVGGKGSVNVLTFKSPPVLVSEFSTNQKEYLDFLKFNNVGELFLGHDLNNNAYLWKLNRINKINTPLLTLNSKSRPTTDLTFINEGSVFASIYNSSSKPHYGMYDILMPQNKNIIAQENFNGTDILFSTPLNSVLIGNSKKGTVNFLDIRKNQIYKTLELPFTEIKFMLLNQYQTQLVCACNDGSIKIISCESLQTIHDYKPFKQDRKPPQIVSLTQNENAIFAASSDGVISLVYLNA